MSDVLIIGGGIAGISAAAALSSDCAVTLLEAEDQLGYHATGRSAAVFLEDYGNDIVRALNTASLPVLRGTPGVLSRKGFLLLGRAEEREGFDHDAAALGAVEISVAEAQSMVPILNPGTCAFAAARDDIWDLDTDLLMQGFLKAARAHGTRIETGARVTAVTRSAGRWQVSDGARDWSADVLINAAGAWADQVAALAGVAPIGLQPMRRSMARIAAPAGHDLSGWPMMDGVGDRWYAKPDAGALLISPADEDPLPPQDAWADDMVLAEGLARYEEMMTAPVTRPLATWAGLRTFAPDRTLVVGRDPVCPAFFWLAGQGGYGFQTCVAAAALTADVLSGRAPGLDAATVAALSPGRFSS